MRPGIIVLTVVSGAAIATLVSGQQDTAASEVAADFTARNRAGDPIGPEHHGVSGLESMAIVLERQAALEVDAAGMGRGLPPTFYPK